MNKQIVIIICTLCIIPLVIVVRMLPTMFKATPEEHKTEHPKYEMEWIVKPYSGPLVKYRDWGFTKKELEIKRGE